MGAKASIPKKIPTLKIVAAALVLLLLALLFMLFSSSGDEQLDALAESQRLIISAQDGKIEGVQAPLTDATPDTKEPEEDVAADPVNEDAPDAILPDKTDDIPPKEEKTDAVSDAPAQDTAAPQAPAAAIIPEKKPETAPKEPKETTEKKEASRPSTPSRYDAYAEFVGEALPSDAELTERPEETRINSAAAQLDEGIDTIPAYPRTNASLNSVTTDLLERTDIGSIPRISKSGVKPSVHYARPFDKAESAKTVSIIISGLGQSKRATEAALKLPYTVSLSFDAYAEHTPVWAESARNLGFETWLDIPLQPADYPASDGGPDMLLAGAEPGVNMTRLQRILARFAGYVGVTSPLNENFSVNRQAMNAVIRVLKKRGLVMVFANRDASIVSHKTMTNNSDHIAIPDVIIDESISEGDIQNALADLEAHALENGHAIGYANAYPLSIIQIAEWAAMLEQKGLMLAPISAVVAK